MPREIEAKVKIEGWQVGVLAGMLSKLSGKDPVKMREVNDFFDMKNRLRKRKEVLRFRTVSYAENDMLRDMQPRYLVTYKGPPLGGKLKQREEVEVEVLSFQARHLLALIGYKPTFSFEKFRRQWEYRGCSVTIDEVPFIGPFVEVEGERVQHIQDVLKELGLHKLKCIKDGYPSLLRDHFKGKKRPPKSVTF